MTRYGRYVIGEKKEANLSLRIESSLNDQLEEYCMKNSITKTELIKTLLKNFLN